MSGSAVAALRAFARPRPRALGEACELCGAALGERHEHVVEPAARALRCACGPCAALGLGAKGRPAKRIERGVAALAGGLDDGAWAALGIPVGLAFVVHWSEGDEVVAFFPGAGGVAASPLDRAAWMALVERSPALARLRPDVEALLVARLPGRRQQWMASLDICHELLGLLRAGEARGPAAAAAVIDRFLAGLTEERRD
jgi:hypothetical protein